MSNKIMRFLLVVVVIISSSFLIKPMQVMFVNDILKIESILLPHNLITRIAISTEEKFDNSNINRKDTVHIKTAIPIELGAELLNFKQIDIRTKIIVTKNDGSIEKLFLNKNGVILFKNKFYKVSESTVKYLRGEIDIK